MLSQYYITLVVINSLVVHGANILAINTLLSPSHHIFNDVYLYELVKQWHNVTLLGHDEDKHGHPNYTHIVMEGVYDKIKKRFNIMDMMDMSEWDIINSVWTYGEITCHLDFQTKGLRSITEYPNDFQFDLIIWDSNNGQCLFPLIEKFRRPPIIAINPFINQANTLRNIWQTYIPFITHTFTDRMTLWQRLRATFFNALFEITKIIYYMPRQQELAESYFGKLNFTVQEIERDVTLMLANYNPVFNYVEALPPNIVPVGGLHIQPKHLPEDLKNLLDRSTHGLILFSLGTNVKSKDLGTNKIQAILKTFSKLKQNIIWKFENEKLTGVPKNVYIRKWVPQNDILGHKNTILLITHGGLLSSHEIIYNGVPVIGIPFYMDQFQNVANLVAKGVGEKLAFHDITEENFYNIIHKMLNTTSYQEIAKKISVLYKHQITSPLETAIFWTEYILKFKTAEHFNLATRSMNFVQLANLDIIFIFFLPFILISFVIFVCILHFIFKCFRITFYKKIKTA